MQYRNYAQQNIIYILFDIYFFSERQRFHVFLVYGTHFKVFKFSDVFVNKLMGTHT